MSIDCFDKFEPDAQFLSSLRIARRAGDIACGERIWCHALQIDGWEIGHLFYPHGTRCLPSHYGSMVIVFRSGGMCARPATHSTMHASELIAYPAGDVPCMTYGGGVHEFVMLARGMQCRAHDVQYLLPVTHIVRVWRLIMNLRNIHDLSASTQILAKILESAEKIVRDSPHGLASLAMLHLETDWQCERNSGGLAAELGVSAAHLCRAFKGSYGISMGRYAALLRLNHAAGLLWGTAIPIGEIALLCGFFDQPHLTRQMFSLMNMTPLCFRRLAPCIGKARLAAVNHVTVSQGRNPGVGVNA